MSGNINEARINDREFSTLAEALQASVAGDTIELLRDVTLSYDLNPKTGVMVLVPRGIKLCAGTYKAEKTAVNAESALFSQGTCTYYGSLIQAVGALGEDDEAIAYGEIELGAAEPLTVPHKAKLTIPYRTSLTVHNKLTVTGELELVSDHSVLHAYGPLNIDYGTVRVNSAAILWLHNEVDFVWGRLLIAGALCGDGKINASAKVLVKSKQQANYYGRLYDALDELDENETNEITALSDVSSFYSVTIPKDSELIIPSGLRYALDTDSSLNVFGKLTIADSCALTGNMMVSLEIFAGAVLCGDGLAACSNFYSDGKKVAAKTDADYSWISIDEEMTEEGWVKYEG